MEKDYVLAMYDIRSKQDFIYRSTHIKEIIGGTHIISDCYNDLYNIAEKESNGKGIFHDLKKDFTIDGLKKHIEEGYIGEVIYNGGGNFLVLFKNKEVCKDLTYKFTKEVMINTGTLKVICTYIENIDFENFKEDRKRLYDKHRKNEAIVNPTMFYASLPISQVDPVTSMPLVEYSEEAKTKVSRESNAKYEKFEEVKNKELDEKVLDEIVWKRGEESMLACIYIDGNSMGAKVQNCIKDDKSYEKCIKSLRDLSSKIEKNYIKDRLEEIDDYLNAKHGTSKKRRYIVSAGDEVTFICDARDAFEVAKIYLKGLPKEDSSCAGISIFHSHSPYSEAYRIAEECCESGKTKMKKHKIDNVCYLDFHYCQGAIGTSLEDIRDLEIGEIISKPWVIRIDDNDKKKIIDSDDKYVDLDDVERVVKILKQFGRSNVKSLAECAKKSSVSLELELSRIRAHMKKEKRENMKEDFEYLENMDNSKKRSIIYDVVIMYDLWFKDYGENKKDN